MAFQIPENGCIKCAICALNCPSNCISEGKNTYIIDAEKCKNCGICASVCPLAIPVGPFDLKTFNELNKIK